MKIAARERVGGPARGIGSLGSAQLEPPAFSGGRVGRVHDRVHEAAVLEVLGGLLSPGHRADKVMELGEVAVVDVLVPGGVEPPLLGVGLLDYVARLLLGGRREYPDARLPGGVDEERPLAPEGLQ